MHAGLEELTKQHMQDLQEVSTVNAHLTMEQKDLQLALQQAQDRSLRLQQELSLKAEVYQDMYDTHESERRKAASLQKILNDKLASLQREHAAVRKGHEEWMRLVCKLSCFTDFVSLCLCVKEFMPHVFRLWKKGRKCSRN